MTLKTRGLARHILAVLVLALVMGICLAAVGAVASESAANAKYSAVADAPDDSRYIRADGLSTGKDDLKKSYLLLSEVSLGKGKKIPCKNLLPMGFKGAVTWKSDDETVLKIAGDKKNTLKPVKYGSAKLTATFADGKTETVEVTVVERRFAATGVNVKKKLDMRVGEIKTPKAKVSPNTAIGRSLLWLTNDASVATVNQMGTITAVSPGKCKIYAVTTGAARKVIDVTVKKAA